MKLKLPNGIMGFYNEKNKFVATGSAMGRKNIFPENRQAPIKLRMKKLKWIGNDYDEGGAYWGYTKGEYIFCAWGEGKDEEYTSYIFTRASSRELAKEFVKRELPSAVFYK